MWISPRIEETKELNGVNLSKCTSCDVYPKLVYWGEPGSYELICPKCGKVLSERGANIRSLHRLAEAWNEGLTDGLAFLKNWDKYINEQ